MGGRRRSATPEEGVPWGREVPHYRCAICLVKVPCADTLASHLRGKDHMKRCKQVEESAKSGREPTSWAGQGERRARQPSQGEREELEPGGPEEGEGGAPEGGGPATPHLAPWPGAGQPEGAGEVQGAPRGAGQGADGGAGGQVSPSLGGLDTFCTLVPQCTRSGGMKHIFAYVSLELLLDPFGPKMIAWDYF